MTWATQLMKRGMNDYLVKPVDRDKLTSAVADAMDARHVAWFPNHDISHERDVSDTRVYSGLPARIQTFEEGVRREIGRARRSSSN